MEKLLVVDGSNLLFQMFYGMPARIVNHRGQAIQGTLGFVGALLKVLRMVQPTQAVAVFDGEVENSRGRLDPSYKANRPDFAQMPEEDTPFSQLPDIYRALDELGIPHRETETCEADDWMAAYALSCPEEDQVVLLSQDSDLFQLLSPRVTVLRYRGAGSVLWDEALLREKLGIAPRQYAAYKALTGDHSDNIPGVPGIGPKTAAALLRQFDSLEQLLSRRAEIAKPSVRRAVEEHQSRILLSHALIRLEGQQPLPFPRTALGFPPVQLSTTQVLQRIGLR